MCVSVVMLMSLALLYGSCIAGRVVAVVVNGVARVSGVNGVAYDGVTVLLCVIVL